MGISYFATPLLVELLENRQLPWLTLSQASTPRLVLFPPFCISLSFPTETALKAKNCGTLLEWSSAANWGGQHTPVIIAYGSKASKGTPMIARVSAFAVVRWGWVSCGAAAW